MRRYTDMAYYLEIGALLVGLFLLFLLLEFLKNPLLIISNSIVGLAVFYLLDTVYAIGIPINIWSIATVGFGGLAGLLLVLVLHYLGLAF